MTKRHLDIANSTAFAAHPCWDLLAEVAKESEHLDNFHDYISNIYSFFTQRMSWGRNLFVQMAKLWHKRRRRSGLGQTIHILGIGKPDNDVYIYRFYTKTKSPYSNWSTSWLLTSWGSCSGRGVWPPIPRGFADWTLGKLQMLPLECKRKSDLRPFFHPREWPLWNWTFSVGGTELRYLTRGRWMIHLEIPEVWSRQYWQVRGVALRERHAFALSHFSFFPLINFFRYQIFFVSVGGF